MTGLKDIQVAPDDMYRSDALFPGRPTSFPTWTTSCATSHGRRPMCGGTRGRRPCRSTRRREPLLDWLARLPRPATGATR